MLKMLCFQTILMVLLVMQVSSMMPRRGPASFVPVNYPDIWTYASNDSRVSVYKTESELCCSGNVFALAPNSYHACCGSSQYDTTREKCCNGVVHELRPGFDCCGSAYFSVKEAKCCTSPLNGRALLKPFPSTILGDVDAIHSTRCCGLKLFNSKTHICCSKNKYGYGYGEPTFTTQSYVGIGVYPTYTIFQKKFKNTACCKGRIYDRSKESCAKEEDQPQIYHSNSQSAGFAPTNYPLPPNKVKCGKEEYDMKTQICCSQFSSENGTFIVVDKLNARKWPNTLCCGSEIYDYETQICCNSSKIHQQNEDGSMECCGAEVFDMKKEQCCGMSNAIVPAESLEGNDSCCGLEKIPYNSRIQTCCGNKVFELPEMELNERRSVQCCWAEDSNSLPSLYNFENETCCKGVKHKKKNIEQPGLCCGSQTFNWDDEICCNDELFNKTTMNHACCGKNIYDSLTNLCCDPVDGVIVAKKSRYESCCGTIAYDYMKEVCCSSSSHSRGTPMASGSFKMLVEPTETAVFPRATETTSCCGLNVIDLDTQQCCGSTPIDKSKELCCIYKDGLYNFKSVAVAKITSHARCCGKDAYDPNTERCCNNTVVQSADKNLPCCGSFVYDPEKQLCCKGKVHDVDKGGKSVECCAENLFDPASQVCCRGAIKDKGEAVPPTACCYPPEEF